MDILFELYKLEPEDIRFNLYKSVVRVNKKTKKEYNDYEVISYGIPFEDCLERIAKDKLKDKSGTTSIPEWIKQYQEIKNELFNCLKK